MVANLAKKVLTEQRVLFTVEKEMPLILHFGPDAVRLLTQAHFTGQSISQEPVRMYSNWEAAQSQLSQTFSQDKRKGHFTILCNITVATKGGEESVVCTKHGGF